MRRRLQFGSLRTRLTVLATVVVAAVLTITAVAVVTIQRRQLTANLDASLDQRADLVAGDTTSGLPEARLATNDDDRAVQLVDARGQVVVSSANLAGEPALPYANPTDARQTIETRRDLPLEDDAYRVLSRQVDTDDGPAVLHVAENIDDLEEALATLVVALLVALPLVVAVLAGLMWWLVGRTLHPVDAMRSDVEAISAHHSDRRINVPAADDEISRLATTMNRMLDRLDDAAARQRRFVADAAHELRTPLTRIRTDVEVDLAHPERADASATGEAVRTEVIALQHLIDDLLHLARSDAGHLSAEHRPVDLDDIVLAEVRQQQAETDVDIDASGVSAAHLLGHSDQLARAVRNVLSNAVRHARSSVVVTLGEQSDWIELAVADDGPGIPEPDRERVFERFARVDDARTSDHGGTGLGLAITRDIVERHGGSIDYDAGWAQGARFMIALPTAPPPAPPTPPTTEAAGSEGE